MKTLLDRLVEYEALAWRYLVATAAWELGGGSKVEGTVEVSALHTWVIGRISELSDKEEDERAA
jgi:hypothetical protein